MENKEFIIIYFKDIIALENDINRKFHEGFLPDGDIVVSPKGDRHESSPIFMQRMKNMHNSKK